MRKVKPLLYWGAQAIVISALLVLFAYDEATNYGTPPLEFIWGMAFLGALLVSVAGAFVRAGP